MNVGALIFVLFFLSGFCGLLYQVVWLRMAFASFGVVTPVLSVVISIFMLGLSVGSYVGGKLADKFKNSTKISPVAIYGFSELMIAVGAFLVPYFFDSGSNYLLTFGEADSAKYMFLSAIIITCAILPFCFFMGMTYPLMMSFLKKISKNTSTSFSFLYLANVIGAMVGTFLTAMVLVEVFGFSKTLFIAAMVNTFIAIVSFTLAYVYRNAVQLEAAVVNVASRAANILTRGKVVFIFVVLFITGFCSMAMEVAWTRTFTPVMRTTIYAFAMLLTIYLLATWIGSYLYRKHSAKHKVISIEMLIALMIVASILPLILNDPRLHLNIVGIIVGIFPFCLLLGYLTPRLIDTYSEGAPLSAGKAYAINIVGCILGPLFAGYVLLPLIGVKWSLMILTIPFLLLFVVGLSVLSAQKKHFAWAVAGLLLCIASALFTNTYEERKLNSYDLLLRDHMATVITDGEGMEKRLYVNGISMTNLTPITKFMAHIPMAIQEKKPPKTMLICFGMGTTFRSLMSWDTDVTAVELIPSVKKVFPFFHSDAVELVKKPNGRIVVDDGRRYLKRTNDKFGVITIDPPPPVEAAGSSLLYSKEFYDLIKMRLTDNGILQQWIPKAERKIVEAVARSLKDSFPYVKIYRSIEGWGFHFFASKNPFTLPSEKVFVQRMPESAKKDLMEWYPGENINEKVADMLTREVDIEDILSPNKEIFISDDRPYNEYYQLRRLKDKYIKSDDEALVKMDSK